MEARSLFAVIAILFLLWLIRTWVKWDSQARRAQLSREKLRHRLTDSTLAGRVRPGSLAASGYHSALGSGRVSRHSSAQVVGATSGPSSGFAGGDTDDDGRQSAGIASGSARSADDYSADPDSAAAISGAAGEELRAEITRLKANLAARDQDVRRNEHALEEVEKLKKTLFERGRDIELLEQSRIKSEENLEQFRSRAQKAALLEQQLAAAHEKAQEQEEELRVLRAQLADSQMPLQLKDAQQATEKHAHEASRATMLGELEQAEAEAKEAQQNSLELRRLRSELASVQSDRSSSARQIEELQARLREQQAALAEARSDGHAAVDVSSLQQELAEREQQNARLQQQISNLLADDNGVDVDEGTGEGAAVQSSNDVSGAGSVNPIEHDSEVAVAAGLRQPRKPLYVAPEGKDDLKLIKGIGPVLERTLNELGVTTFKQLAEFTPQDVAKVSEAIDAFPGRIERDDWVGKAQELMQARSHPV